MNFYCYINLLYSRNKVIMSFPHYTEILNFSFEDGDFKRVIENFVDCVHPSSELLKDGGLKLFNPLLKRGVNRPQEHDCFKYDRKICSICGEREHMYCPYCKANTIHNCGKSQVLCCQHCNRPPVCCDLCENPPVNCSICCLPLSKKKTIPNPMCKSCRRKHYLFVVASFSNRNGDLLNYASEYFMLRIQLLEEVSKYLPTVLAGIVMDF